MSAYAAAVSAFSQLEGDLLQWRFSFRVRDEDVPALFYSPRTLDEPVPLVIIQHPAAGSKDDYEVAEAARLWAARGWICGGFDLPLHGDRVPCDPLAVLREPARLAAVRDRYRDEFSTVVDDLTRWLPVDTARLGFVGYALGAELGREALAADGRFRAAVLCLAGDDASPAGANPAPRLHDIAVRVIGKTEDTLVPRAATQRLYDGLAGTRDLIWLPGGHFDLGPGLAEAALDWLKSRL